MKFVHTNTLKQRGVRGRHRLQIIMLAFCYYFNKAAIWLTAQAVVARRRVLEL